MSLSIPRRRLFQPATSLLPQHPSAFLPLITTTSIHQNRTLISGFKNPFRRKRQHLDPLSPNFLKSVDAKKEREKEANEELPKAGGLAPGSIFDEKTPSKRKGKHEEKIDDAMPRDPFNMAAALDPTPHARKRWQRKMLIREIKGRGRMSRTDKILRTERSHLSKSPFYKTSIKKLYPLARQIAGKPLTEAMVQMRFSKKKAAQDVLRHLEYARDQAIVMKGMGLGNVRREGESLAASESEAAAVVVRPEVVEDKKGKKRVVADRSAMYVDEAWVGRGTYEFGLDYRAKGQYNRLRLPFTSISVVLKEEATRIRRAAEREAKRLRKKVWVPLPDRPITAQRQFPLW